MITVYGIKNCDTCRKALKWLSVEGIEHSFVDFRKDGLNKTKIEGWIKEIGIDTLVNRRGTTWRKLPKADQAGVETGNASTIIAENPTLLKRPIFDVGQRSVVGFAGETQDTLRAFR